VTESDRPVPDGSHEITDLLIASGRDAMDDERLVAAVYEDLKRIARARRRGERDELTLGTTDLVHESYLRLVDQRRAEFEHRRHFYRVAAMMMRRVLVDHARRRLAERRGGDLRRVTLDEADLSVEQQADLVVEVDDLLEKLGAIDARLPRVVECRWFAGYTVAETAEVLEVNERTVRRDWQRARALLGAELGPG
jgi:RNA polymerase sigma factor (TIGR02999 family)